MFMLLSKILHNFSKWRSSSTSPFSNASSSSTFPSIPGLRLSPRSILLMRLPLQFLFGLLSLSYPSSVQFGVVQQYPALLSYCRWTALFPFCFSHTLFCSGLWRITFFFTVFLFCAGIANLELVRWLRFFFHISVWKIPALPLLSVATFKVLSRESVLVGRIHCFLLRNWCSGMKFLSAVFYWAAGTALSAGVSHLRLQLLLWVVGFTNACGP